MSRFSIFSLAHPIIQAPMAGVSTPALAAAVSNAGALGSIAIGAMDASTSRKVIRQTRDLTSRPFNVNVFTHARPRRSAVTERDWCEFLRPDFERAGGGPPEGLEEIYKTFDDDVEKIRVLEEERVSVVSFHFGLPSAPNVSRLKSAGALVMATVTNREEAALAEAHGIDVLVAQGYEAGGHRGVFDPTATDDRLNTVDLLCAILQHTSLPVVAAGGIMDGRVAREMLNLGATAVQMGTAFLLCPESSTGPAYRQAVAAATPTHMTSFVSGRPARSLTSHFTTMDQRNPGRRPPDYPLTYDAGKRLDRLAREQGDHGYGAFWAGKSVAACREITAAQLISSVAQEMHSGVM